MPFFIAGTLRRRVPTRARHGYRPLLPGSQYVALFYHWYFCANSLKNLEHNILGCCGIAPIKANVIGMVESSAAKHRKWIETFRALPHFF